MTSALPRPLAVTQLYILLVLTDGPLHGYAIKAAVRNASLGSVDISDSNLYPLLRRLHDEGLTELAGQQPAGPSGHPRLHYQLAKQGVLRLRQETYRLDHLVEMLRLRHLLDQTIDPELDQLLLDYAKIRE